MPKLAIYVPKEQMKVIDRWRKKINFSKVFMEALTREIRERSRSLKAPRDKLAEAARHYKSRLAESAPSLVDFAFELGTRHVLDCRLEPDAIARVQSLAEAEELSPGDVKQIASAIGDDLAEIEEFAARSGINDKSHPTYKAVAARGYARGVASAWKEVLKHINK